jgi:hypothetical protein
MTAPGAHLLLLAFRQWDFSCHRCLRHGVSDHPSHLRIAINHHEGVSVDEVHGLIDANTPSIGRKLPTWASNGFAGFWPGLLMRAGSGRQRSQPY